MYLPIPFLFSMIEEDSGGVSGTFNKIYANDFAANDHFGYSVAISGDGNTLVIGSRNDDDKGSDSGSAYVFIKNGTMWLQQQKLIASDGAASDNFGWVVSISHDGNTIAVGAYRDDDKGSDSGSVYIFNRVNNNWSETKKIVLSNGTALDYFGYDLELSGDGNTIIIGAYGDNDDVSTNIEVGSAIIYEYDGTDWLFKQKLRPTNIGTNTEFGSSVSINYDGTRSVIGARRSNEIATSNGSVFIFEKVSNVWIETKKILAYDAAINHNFGREVYMSKDGNNIFVTSNTSELASNSGSVYVYVYHNNDWVFQSKLYSNDLTASAYFGQSICSSYDGNTLIIGASGLIVSSKTNAGAVYVYKRVGSTWNKMNKFTEPTPISSDYLGYSVSISSNGLTSVLGMWGDDDKGSSTGAAFVYYI